MIGIKLKNFQEEAVDFLFNKTQIAIQNLK